MGHLQLAVSHVAVVLAAALISAIGQGAVLALSVTCCVRLFRRLNASVRSTVWIIAFVVTALLPLAACLRAPAPVGGGPATPQVQLGASWAVGLLVVWALASCFRAVQLLASATQLRALSARATPVPDGMQRVFGAEPHALRSRVRLYLSAEVDVPSVFGFLHPRVLLPPHVFEQSTPSELRQIVLHELAHLAHRDHWVNLLQKTVLVFFPLHPVLLWMERRLCLERELACDDAVLRVTGARKSYATCLTNLAERSLVRRTLSLALGAWSRRSELAGRVYRILQKDGREMTPLSSGMLAGALLSGVLLGATALTQLPPLVSFTSEAVPSANVPVAQAEAAATPGSTMSMGHAQLRLTSAVMSSTSKGLPYAAPVRHRASGRPAGLRAVPARVFRKRIARPAEPPVVLIGWRGAAPAGAFQLTVFEEPPSYAAVAVRNGWMIFQL